MTRTLYVLPELINETHVSIQKEEAFHAFKVLRAKQGDEFKVVDGQGSQYIIRLEHIDRNSGLGEIVSSRKQVGELSFRLDLAISPIKNRDRWEFAIEKAAELGVSKIIPLKTSRTERPKLNATRLEKKLVSALKQSGRSVLPAISDLMEFDKLLSIASEYDVTFLCSAFSGAQSLNDSLDQIRKGVKVLVCIGPEGGFTKSEVGDAAEEGVKIVSLGARRLRTETAAIASLCIVGQK